MSGDKSACLSVRLPVRPSVDDKNDLADADGAVLTVTPSSLLQLLVSLLLVCSKCYFAFRRPHPSFLESLFDFHSRKFAVAF